MSQHLADQISPQMGGFIVDPLADIPEEESDKPRGDPALAIFRVPMAVRPDECKALLDLFWLHHESGQTEILTHSNRLSRVYLGGSPAWESSTRGVFVPDGTAKLYTRLAALIHAQNFEHWQFDLARFPHPCIAPAVTLDWQEAGEEGVTWHSDYTAKSGADWEPKLVAIVQLSDPAAYDGGEFEVYSGTRIVRPELEQGDMILFPSFLLHRRQPITRGHRFILMVQAWGPRWR